MAQKTFTFWLWQEQYVDNNKKQVVHLQIDNKEVNRMRIRYNVREMTEAEKKIMQDNSVKSMEIFIIRRRYFIEQ